MPFDLERVSFEKEKTYTIHKVKKFIANIGDDNINNKYNKKINKMEYFEQLVNDKNNNNSSNLNITNIIHKNNKSPTFIKNRNKSNIYSNTTNSKKEDKSFETNNQFYSVRNKYKKLALQKDNNSIKTPPPNMPVEPLNKEKYNSKRNSNYNISQNISPRNLKRDELIKNNDETKFKYNNNYNIKPNIKIEEFNKYNFKTKINGKNRNYFLTKNAPDNDMKEKNKDMKYFKLKMNLLPKTKSKYSKSHMKIIINDRNYNANVTDINQKNPVKIYYKNNIKKNYKKNNITVSEINFKNDISNDLNDNHNKVNGRFTTNDNDSKYNNKISYVLNSTNSKNKSITYFNIRVIDNNVQENNKINKNNAFYFSRYSKRKIDEN